MTNAATLRVTGRNCSRWRAWRLLRVYLLIALHVTHWLASGRTNSG